MTNKDALYFLNQIEDTFRKTKSIYRTGKDETAFDRAIMRSEEGLELLREYFKNNVVLADVSHSAKREEAIKWFKSLPFIKARSYAINHTNRFIRQPFTELTGREMQEIWSQHCG